MDYNHYIPLSWYNIPELFVNEKIYVSKMIAYMVHLSFLVHDLSSDFEQE